MAPAYSLMIDLISDDQGRFGAVPEVVPVDWSHTFPHVPRDDPNAPQEMDSIVCSSAYPLLTRAVNLHYADNRIVQRHWESLERYMTNLVQRAAPNALPDFEVDCGGSSNQSSAVYQAATGGALAAFKFISAADAMASMADALGNAHGAARYRSLARASRKEWHARYWNASLSAYGYEDSENGLVCQGLSAAALVLGALPPGRADKVLTYLQSDMQARQHHFTVGEVGVRPLLNALSASGMHADALKLVLQRSFPSYGWWLERNATTCWES